MTGPDLGLVRAVLGVQLSRKVAPILRRARGDGVDLAQALRLLTMQAADYHAAHALRAAAAPRLKASDEAWATIKASNPRLSTADMCRLDWLQRARRGLAPGTKPPRYRDEDERPERMLGPFFVNREDCRTLARAIDVQLRGEAMAQAATMDLRKPNFKFSIG